MWNRGGVCVVGCMREGVCGGKGGCVGMREGVCRSGRECVWR